MRKKVVLVTRLYAYMQCPQARVPHPQVDVEALNAQVEEKKQRKAAEQAIEQ